MNSTDLAVLVPWVIKNGYWIILFFATVEGPLITIAAGVAAALGYFNIFIILALSFIGDLGGDFLYYGIGYMLHTLIHSPFFRYFGLTELKIANIEKRLKTHIFRTIVFIKLSPLIGGIGIVVIGAARPKFKKFLKPALSVAIPKSLFFALLGYFSGQAYLKLNQVIADGENIAIYIALALLIIYIIYIQIMKQVTKRIEE